MPVSTPFFGLDDLVQEVTDYLQQGLIKTSLTKLLNIKARYISLTASSKSGKTSLMQNLLYHFSTLVDTLTCINN